MYGQPLKRLPTFRRSVETGIYVDAHHQRAGGGRKLYTQLLRRLTQRGYRQVARKHDSWHDVAWMQLDLLDTGDRMDRLARFAEPRRGSMGR